MHNLAGMLELNQFNKWISFYPALVEFRDKYPFFKPLMIIIAMEKLHRVTLDKLLFAGSASVGSVMDFATDLYTIVYYFSVGKNSSAWAMLAFVVTSISIQTFVSIIAHSSSKTQMLKEIIYTVTLVKPAINEFRVMTNRAPKGHELIDSLQELVMFRTIEIFAEAIPCTLIQVAGEQGEKIIHQKPKLTQFIQFNSFQSIARDSSSRERGRNL